MELKGEQAMSSEAKESQALSTWEAGADAAGPLLPPGFPGIPAPEFGPPGLSWASGNPVPHRGIGSENDKTRELLGHAS